jgi:hypothetical protein
MVDASDTYVEPFITRILCYREHFGVIDRLIVSFPQISGLCHGGGD